MNTIGIDLGTYNSAASVAIDSDNVIMVESRCGPNIYGKSFPSFVYFDRNGVKQVVGNIAKNFLSINSTNSDFVIWGVKRLVGISYEEAKNNNELERFDYKTEKDEYGRILIRIADKSYTPTDILQFILQEIKEDAENPEHNPLIGHKIEKAVITVPAYFKAYRTNFIIEAAKKAGFTEVETVAEPTAAAIEYCRYVKMDKESNNILVFDMGAGTLDISVMCLVNMDGNLIPGELSTSGNPALGGIDMDDKLTSYIINKYGIVDLKRQKVLKGYVENSKIRLSDQTQDDLFLPGASSVPLTCKELEEVLKPIIEKCRGPIRIALRQAKLTASDLDHVLFVGGPTRMPCIRQLVIDELKALGANRKLLEELKDYKKIHPHVDPMECVAKGAALKAGGFTNIQIFVHSEGYGVSYRSENNLPDYYASIIEPNSHYPIKGEERGVEYGSINLKEIRFEIITKTIDPDKSLGGNDKFKYESAGFFPIAITPTGKLPTIDVILEIDRNKRLIVELTHRQSGQHVIFVQPYESKEREMQRQEHTCGYRTDEERKEQESESREEWTKEHLERYIHIAQKALDLGGHTETKVSKSVSHLREAIDTAIKNEYKDPNNDCPTISNRAKELLGVLIQAGYITEAEYKNYIDQIVKIPNKR